jgi:class 3 adenylate cyclase/tetratricopeptide (TPR) repeat protein
VQGPSRTPGVKVCPKCAEENPERFRLCGFCGTPLPGEQPSEVRKTVTIVFCDLKGSTSLAERLDTESLREVLSLYFGEMQRVLERHGGAVEKYIGDAIVAVFGLPQAHEDDALRAVRAGAQMHEALVRINEELDRRWGIRLANRTGINTGEVVASEVTVGQRLVAGDTVNVAARLEQAAPEMEILLGESTYRLVRDTVEVEVIAPLELKGKAERVPAYRLIAVKAKQPFAHRLDTPLVGRDAELGLLRQRFDRAVRDRSAQLLTVVGEAGVGKSRLIHEFVTGVQADATVLRGGCPPYGEGITFWPLGEVVRQAAGVEQYDPADLAIAKLTALAGADAEAVVDRVAAAIGLSVESFPVAETFWAARKLLEDHARNRPLVIVIDDIHWAEATFLDLLDHLADSVHDAALLLLCSARQDLLEERTSWAEGRPNDHLIHLGPLSEEDSARIVGNLLGDLMLPPELRDRIIRAAEGNPLFVEQMLSMLLDEGLLSRGADGGWVVSPAAASAAVPPSILALLAARLDRLGREERAVLDRGSVIGQVFHRGAVVALSPGELPQDIDTSLTALSQKQLIRPDQAEFAGEDAFRFHHILIRDVSYQGLMKRARISLHEAYAGWLEHRAATLLEYEEIRGYHLEQAYRYRSELGTIDEEARRVGDRAAQLLAAAGRRAFASGDMPAAANLLGRAASLPPSEDPFRLALLPDLGEALMDLGEFARAEDLVEEAIRGAVASGDPRLEMDAMVVKLLIRSSVEERAWADQILRDSERAISLLEEAGDQRALARAWRLVGFVQATAGKYGAAEEALRKAIELARSVGDRREETRNLSIYAACALYGPMPVPEAIRHCEELLDRTTGNQREEGLIRLYLSQLYAMTGAFNQARDLYRNGRAALVDAGQAVLAAFTASNSARVELLAEDPAAAEQELRRDCEALERMGEKYFLSTVAGLLAQALYLRGSLEEAERYSRVSEDTAGDDVESQSLWRRARAKILARWGRYVEAEALAREAASLVEQTESPSTRGNTLLDLAVVLEVAGKPQEALSAANEALALHERKGNAVTAARAKAVLRWLGEATPSVEAPPWR